MALPAPSRRIARYQITGMSWIADVPLFSEIVAKLPFRDNRLRRVSPVELA